MLPKVGRTRSVQDAPIQKLLSDVNIGPDVISLGQGVPFYGPPLEAVEGAKKSLSTESGFRYTEDSGLFSLREAISLKLKKESNISSDPLNSIMVTVGGNQAFVNALLAATEVADDVLLFSPYYFNNYMAVKLAGCNPIVVETADDYQPNLDELHKRVTPKTRALITISPNNPTGAVYSERTLKGINDFCLEHDIFHISDEAYEHFVFDSATHTSPLKFSSGRDNTISIFSFSKSYGMSGYRIGYMVYPPELNDEVLKVQDTVGICPPGPSQAAAEAALKFGDSYPKSFLPTMTKVRNLLKNRLGSLDGLELVQTEGSFYFLLKLHTTNSSLELAKKLIEDHSVITIPGEVFGATFPSLRVSYGNLTLDRAE